MSVVPSTRQAVLRVVPLPDFTIANLPVSDYDTGVYTPAVTGSSGGTFLANASGQWVKVGNLVSFTAYVDLNGANGSTGNMQISLPPFAVSASAPTLASINIGYASMTLTSGYGQILGRIGPGSTSALLIQYSADNTALGFATVPVTAAGAATFFYVNGQYATDD